MIRLLKISEGEHIHINLIKSKYRLYTFCEGSGLGCDVIVKTQKDSLIFSFDTIFKEHSFEFDIFYNQEIEIIYITKNLGSSLYKINDTISKTGIVTIISHYCPFKYLKRSIDSIIHQTLKPDKVILFDDKCLSSDELMFIKKHYGDWIEIYTNRINLGPFVNKNLALIDCIENYDFINFIDSDDFILHNTIKKMNSILRSNKNVKIVNTLMKRIIGNKVLNESSDSSLIDLSMLCQSGFMCKSEVFNEVGFFDSCKYGSDSEFYYRANKVLGYGSVNYLFDTLYYAELRKNSLTTSYATRNIYNDNTINGICSERIEYSNSFDQYIAKSSPISIKKRLPSSINVFRRIKIRIICFNDHKGKLNKYINVMDKLGIDVCVSVVNHYKIKKRSKYKRSKYVHNNGIYVYMTYFMKIPSNIDIAKLSMISLSNDIWKIKKVDKSICRWYFNRNK